MSGSGRASLRFGLEDIECQVESGVKKGTEQRDKSPVPKKPTSRVKTIKRKKESDGRIVALFEDKDFEGVGDMAFEVMNTMFKKLRDDRRKIEEEVVRLKAEKTKEVTAAVDAAVEAVRVEKDKEMVAAVEAAVAEAKDAATLAVLDAKIKIAKEASDPSFNRAAWNVKQWELFSEKLVGEIGRKVALVCR